MKKKILHDGNSIYSLVMDSPEFSHASWQAWFVKSGIKKPTFILKEDDPKFASAYEAWIKNKPETRDWHLTFEE